MQIWMALFAISVVGNGILGLLLLLQTRSRSQAGLRLELERRERGRIADAFRESQACLRVIFASPLLGMHFWEGGRASGSGNAAFCKMLGLPAGESHPDDVLGGFPVRLAPPLLGPKQEEEIRARGLCTPFETEYQRADGTWVNLLVAAGLLEGFPDRGVCLVLDITRLMETRRELQASQERYDALAESSPVGIWHVHPDGRTIYINPAMCAVLEVDSPAEMMASGTTYHEFFSPESLQAVRVQHVTRRERGLSSNYEVDLIGKWGRRTRMLLCGAPVTSADGKLDSLMGTFLDITERMREEEALRQSEERFRVAAECSNDLIYEWDLVSGRLDWFGPLEERLGFAAGGIPRTREAWELLIHPEDLGRVRSALERQLRLRQPLSQEYRIRTGDGAYRQWTDRGTALWDASGRPSKWIGATTDVSDGRRAEETLRAKEDQLRQSQKLEAVGRLAGGIAHDFNNMLAAIMGYCELLLIRLEPAHPCRREVGEILNGSERAAGLIRQLLAFSRQEIPQPRVISPNSVIAAMESMLRHLVEETIELRMELDREAGCIRMDPVQVEQVILNLVLNARDAMPKGGLLTLTTARVDLEKEIPGAYGRVRPGGYVRVSVRDSGMGINKEHLPHIFDPFFTTKDRGKGSGLGLSTVYGIVTQNLGCVQVETEVGKGSVFCLYLPVTEELPETETEVKKALHSSSFLSRTVLLVEDDEEVRAIVRELLSQQGFRVIEARKGSEALEAVEKADETVHLLLTDVVMPGMDGMELAESLRLSHPGLKVLFMSGYTQDNAFREDVAEGNRAFIQKPFTLSTLVAKIWEVLR